MKAKKEINVTLRLSSIICSTILGCLTLVGIFWGKDGLLTLGVGILGSLLIIILFTSTT